MFLDSHLTEHDILTSAYCTLLGWGGTAVKISPGTFKTGVWVSLWTPPTKEAGRCHSEKHCTCMLTCSRTLSLHRQDPNPDALKMWEIKSTLEMLASPTKYSHMQVLQPAGFSRSSQNSSWQHCMRDALHAFGEAFSSWSTVVDS